MKVELNCVPRWVATSSINKARHRAVEQTGRIIHLPHSACTSGGRRYDPVSEYTTCNLDRGKVNNCGSAYPEYFTRSRSAPGRRTQVSCISTVRRF